ANPALVARAVRAGASAYLTNDFSMQDIVAAVETVAAGDVVLSPNLAGSMLRELTAPPHVKHDLITKREADALRLLADGYSTHEVASRLLVSDRALCHDLSSAYGKLDAEHAEAMLDRVHWGIISRAVSAIRGGSGSALLLALFGLLTAAAHAVHREEHREGDPDEQGEQHARRRPATVLL